MFMDQFDKNVYDKNIALRTSQPDSEILRSLIAFFEMLAYCMCLQAMSLHLHVPPQTRGPGCLRAVASSHDFSAACLRVVDMSMSHTCPRWKTPIAWAPPARLLAGSQLRSQTLTAPARVTVEKAAVERRELICGQMKRKMKDSWKRERERERERERGGGGGGEREQLNERETSWVREKLRGLEIKEM